MAGLAFEKTGPRPPPRFHAPYLGPWIGRRDGRAVGSGQKKEEGAERGRQRTPLRRWLTEVPPDGPLLGFVLYPELGYPYTTEYLGLKTT